MTDNSFDTRTGWAALRAWLLAQQRWERLLLALILIAGAYLRLTHLDWDQGTHIHPDERFLTMVLDALELPKSLGEFFDSTRSPMSPYNKGYGFFVYGTLPIFIVRVIAEVADKFNKIAQLWTLAPGAPLDLTGYGGVHLVGRALSGLFDLACVWLIYGLGRRLYSRRAGLLASALYAFAVLPLQQSHFFTVDTFGTFFALLTFYWAVRVAQGGEPGARHDGGWLTYVALGASLGASLACRINLAPLAIIALLAAGIRAWDDWQRAVSPARFSKGREAAAWLSTLFQATLFRLLLMLLVAVAVFRVAQPYAFGGTSILDFTFSEQWKDNMHTVRLLMSGDADTPPGHQWTSRTPFVFPFVNMVVWGLGLPLGLSAWAGWALALYQVLRGLTRVPAPVMAGQEEAGTIPAWRNHLLPVAWIGGMFLWQGLQYVQSMRYLLPIYPHLAMMAAWLLWWLVDRAREEVRERGKGVLISMLPRLAYALLALVVVGTMLWGWGFLAIYRRPLTRITASRWMYENIPPGSHIANEHWDDGLPLRIDGKDPFGSFGYKGLSSSSDGNMQMYWEDTPEKREQLYQWLNEADYIVLSSNRLWGSIPRLPMRYPMTTLYYRLLFAEKLGFKQVLHVTSFPTIFGIEFNDTWAEEAFSVYDHPEVYIFQKTPAYSEALARSYLDAVDLEFTIQMWPKQIGAAPTALMMTEAEASRQRAGGTWADIFDLKSLLNRSQVVATAAWLLLVALLGIMAFPFAFCVLPGLPDRGYGVSKVLGVLLLAWLSWLGPSLKAVPYQRWWIAFCLGLLIGVAGGLAWRRRVALAHFIRTRYPLLLTEEALFLALFGLFLLIRIGNPDLWHPARGGEKPMEFAYLNAVIKSTTFPPYDPWHAGGYMNYYYFGFVIVGTLVKLIGIVPWVAYNLTVPTLFALTGLAAFTVAYALAEVPGKLVDWEKSASSALLAGLAATLFVVIIGNLGNVKLLFDQWALRSTVQFESTIPGLAKLVRGLNGAWAWLSGKQPLDFPNDWWFWNASRVIPDTINEFPFFTFVYADLHAHMIALPLTLLGLAIAVAMVRDRQALAIRGEPSPWRIPLPELLPLLLMGLVLGALRATNTWDFPTYVLVGLAAIGVLIASQRLKIPLPTTSGGQGVADPSSLAFLFRAVVAVLWRGLLLLLVATLTFYPFTKYYATAYAGLERWEGATTTIPDYLTMWGFFLALVLIYLLSELAVQIREGQIPDWLQDILPLVIGLVLVGVGVGWAVGARVWVIALPLAALAAVLSVGRDIPPTRRLGLLLIGLALAITMGVEVVRQQNDIGRMNTVFKFYIQAWVLFGVGSACGLLAWAERSTRWVPGLRRLAWAVTILLFVGAMIYPPTAAPAKIRDRFSAEASPHGLDGMAYMDKAQYYDNNRELKLADDKEAMLWMLRNIKGSPVILEGNSPGYRWGNRFSIYTGLPAVQGWDWHQKQQRSVVPHSVIDRRLNHVREMYDTTNLWRARYLLDRYQVSYIIVGELERAYYSPEGLAKFDTLVEQGYLDLVYVGGSVRIYQVVGRATSAAADVITGVGPQPVPTPASAGASAPLESPLPSAEPFLSPVK